MKNTDKILEVLAESSPLMKKDIVDKSGITKSSAGIFLRKLINEGTIEKLSYGEYSITDKGKERVEVIKQKYPNNAHQEVKKQNLSSNNQQFEDLKVLLGIKEKYSGNKEMLDLMRQILK